MTESRLIEWTPGQTVTAVIYRAKNPAALLVLAHGAGASQYSDFMRTFSMALAAADVTTATFNFPYTERDRKLPDRQPILEACYRGVLRTLVIDPTLATLPWFIGGKSMGGRMASHIATAPDADAAGGDAWWPRLRGLVFLGYPLHPPARREQVRVSHLPSISHPMIFVQGERDAFGTPAEIHAFADVLPAPCTVVTVTGGDHSFDVLKRSGLNQDDVLARAQHAILEWIRTQLATTAG